jgi:hypothetical protein
MTIEMGYQIHVDVADVADVAAFRGVQAAYRPLASKTSLPN